MERLEVAGLACVREKRGGRAACKTRLEHVGERERFRDFFTWVKYTDLSPPSPFSPSLFGPLEQLFPL